MKQRGNLIAGIAKCPTSPGAQYNCVVAVGEISFSFLTARELDWYPEGIAHNLTPQAYRQSDDKVIALFANDIREARVPERYSDSHQPCPFMAPSPTSVTTHVLDPSHL